MQIRIGFPFLMALVPVAALLPAGCATPRAYPTETAPVIFTALDKTNDPVIPSLLDENSAVSMAIKYNPEIIALRAQVAITEADRQNAVEIRDPELRISYNSSTANENRYRTSALTNAPWIARDTYGNPITDFPAATATRLETVPSSGSGYQAAARFFPPNPWTKRSRISAADAMIEAAKGDLHAKEWQITSDVRRIIEDIHYLREDLEFIHELATLSSNTVVQMQTAVRQGTLTVMDSINASRDHLRSINDLTTTKQALDTAIKSLAQITGLPVRDIMLDDRRAPVPDLDVLAIDPAFLQVIAVRDRADVAASGWRVRAADASVHEALGASLPWFSFLQASYGHAIDSSRYDPYVQWTGGDGTVISLPSYETITTDQNSSEWRVDFGITLPVFTWTRDPAAPQRAERARCSAELSTLLRAVSTGIKDSVSEMEMASTALHQYGDATALELERLRSILKKGREQGSILPDNVSRIRFAIIEVERNKCRLTYEYRKAFMSLKRNVGRDLDFVWGTRPTRTNVNSRALQQIRNDGNAATTTNPPVVTVATEADTVRPVAESPAPDAEAAAPDTPTASPDAAVAPESMPVESGALTPADGLQESNPEPGPIILSLPDQESTSSQDGNAGMIQTDGMESNSPAAEPDAGVSAAVTGVIELPAAPPGSESTPDLETVPLETPAADNTPSE